MSLQLPTQLTAQNQAIIAPQQSSAALEPIMQVGRILSVTVSNNPDQPSQKGLMLQGSFIAATLPEGLNSGTQLKVQVQQNLDAIVLKILDQSLTSTNQATQEVLKVANELKNIFQTISNDPKLSHLKQLYQPFNQLIDDQSSNSGVTQNNNSLTTLLQKLSLFKGILNPEQLKDPTQLSAALIKAISQNINNSNDQTSKSLLELSKVFSSLLPSMNTNGRDHKFVEQTNLGLTQLRSTLALENELRSILSNLADNSAESVAQHDSSEIAKRIEKLIDVISELRSDISYGLGQLLQNGKAKMNNHPVIQESDSFLNFTKELLKELQALEVEKYSDLNNKDPQIREQIKSVINKAILKIKERFPISEQNMRELNTNQQASLILKSLEGVFETQRILSTLNPSMQLAGEPIFLLLPFLGQSFISTCTATFSNAVDAPDPDQDPKKQKNANRQCFESLELSLSLPNLGPVGVSLAHRSGQLFLSLAIPDHKAIELTESELPKLKERFKTLGYQELDLKLIQATPKEVTPNWVKKIIESKSVVA